MASGKENVSANYLYLADMTNVPLYGDIIEEDDEFFRDLFTEECISLKWNSNGLFDQNTYSDTASISSGKSLSSKSSFDSDESENIDLVGWTTKPHDEWQITDTICWLILASAKLGHSYGKLSPAFAISGKELFRLTKIDFFTRDRNFGEKLYDLLHTKYDSISLLPRWDTSKSLSDDETSVESDSESSDAEDEKDSILGIKRRPGRPPLRHPRIKEPRQKLWEFIRSLLFDPKYCPRVICWEDYDTKTFRLVQSREIAKLWGERNNKENNKMTYEKFSRAMRYYYKKGIFMSVPGRRLIYKFGAMATGLETDCPNFDPDYYKDVTKARL